MKKTLAMLLAMVMLFALCAPAMAEAPTGKITVNSATVGHTYSLYRLLDLASYSDSNPDNPDDGQYAYKVNTKWAGFFAEESTKAYIYTDENGVITWKTGADAAAFAQAALAYADTKGITADASDVAESETIEFDRMPLGYYLLDSTVGALCSLDTNNPNATIEDKNYLPTLTKKVEGKDETTASIGDTVDFELTVVVGVGYSSYTLTDDLPDGLTLNASSIKVAIGDNELTAGIDYTLTTAGLTDADFQIVFGSEFLAACENEDVITVTYSALVNANATAQNTNTATLTTDNNVEKGDTATVYTYKFDLVKTDSTKNLLPGASFELYDAKTAGNKIELIYVEGKGYRPAIGNETAAAIEVTNGNVTIYGLASGTYYLEETVAPTGYNMLAERFEVKLTGDLIATLTGNAYTSGGVQVTNYTGSELPSTGGIGTTVFYAMGGLLMAAAVVLLVTRKKTESNK